jgi:hypothetical protein
VAVLDASRSVRRAAAMLGLVLTLAACDTSPQTTPKVGADASPSAAIGASGGPARPTPDPSDPWHGGEQIPGSKVDTIKAQLSQRWGLTFGPENAIGGPGSTAQAGTVGDPTQHNLQLIARLDLDSTNGIRAMLCIGSGQTADNGPGSRTHDFIYDCLRTSVTDDAWAALKPWLDTHYNEGHATFTQAGINVALQSSEHTERALLGGT